MKSDREFILNPGLYVLGDPSLLFEDDIDVWIDMLHENDHFTVTPLGNISGSFNQDNREVCIFGTANGDGTFFDQFSNEYIVVSGMTGIVPVAADTKESPLGTRLIEFDEPITCFDLDGFLHFGQFVIDTNVDEAAEDVEMNESDIESDEY